MNNKGKLKVWQATALCKFCCSTNSPHTSLFPPQIPKAQPNRHLYYPQNTLPHPQKAPWLKWTQNNKNRTKFRVFSASSISPLLDNEITPNLRWNRTHSIPTHTQKVLKVKQNKNNRNFSQKHRHITPCTSTMDPTVHALLKDMKKHILELQAINSRKMKTLKVIERYQRQQECGARPDTEEISLFCQGNLQTKRRQRL